MDARVGKIFDIDILRIGVMVFLLILAHICPQHFIIIIISAQGRLLLNTGFPKRHHHNYLPPLNRVIGLLVV